MTICSLFLLVIIKHFLNKNTSHFQNLIYAYSFQGTSTIYLKSFNHSSSKAILANTFTFCSYIAYQISFEYICELTQNNKVCCWLIKSKHPNNIYEQNYRTRVTNHRPSGRCIF